MRLALPALLSLLLPAVAPRQSWYDPDLDYERIPTTAADGFAALDGVDLGAALRLAVETAGGRPESADVVPGPEPYCEVQLVTEEARRILRIDPSGTTVISNEIVPRFAGWEAPSELSEWTTLDSGVRYYDIEVGKGREPRNSTALVTVHYEGFLTDGSKFQSTWDAKRPSKSPLSGGVSGWREALLTMRTGGKRKILIPADKAYGASGKAPFVPPNATLLFDVHLLKVQNR